MESAFKTNEICIIPPDQIKNFFMKSYPNAKWEVLIKIFKCQYYNSPYYYISALKIGNEEFYEKVYYDTKKDAMDGLLEYLNL